MKYLSGEESLFGHKEDLIVLLLPLFPHKVEMEECISEEWPFEKIKKEITEPII